MSKPNGRRLKLTEMRAQAHEAMGVEPGFEIELDDGSIFNIPSPMMLDDVADAAMRAAGTDSVALARAVLGDDGHAALLAGGGRSNDVVLAWNLMRTDLEKAGPTLPR